MNPALRAIRNALLCITFLEMLIVAQMASVSAFPDTVVKVEPEASTVDVGETFTINIKLTDVQNLFGLEVTLHWDPPILQMDGADVRLGVESHPDGVLHEPLYVLKNETIQEEGKYQLVATSTGRETPAFSGSGNVVKISFEVVDVGSCELTLETKLADKPPYGGVSSPIAHTTIDGFFGVPEQPTWPYITTLIVVIIIVAMVITAATAIYYKRIKRVEGTLHETKRLFYYLTFEKADDQLAFGQPLYHGENSQQLHCKFLV